MSAAKPEDRARILNRAARERSLIEAAAKLFSAQGFAATTTRQIAAEAGCAEGLISRYFKGKAGLLRALIHLHFSEEVDEFRDDSPPAATLADEIVRRVSWDFDHLGADYEFLRIIIPQVILDPALAPEVRGVGPGRHEKLIVERLSKYSEFCSLSPEEQDAVAQAIFAVGLMFSFWHPAMGEDRAQAKQRAMTIARILGRAI
jgi:AcrR family transcriptional regulator